LHIRVGEPVVKRNPGLVSDELDLPDEVYGFGSWLLWVLATRATDVVDQAFAAGPARPSKQYGIVDGHPVPTPSLVAWLLVAAEYRIALEQLSRRDKRLNERQKVLRTIVSRAIGGEPRLFKDSWLRDLGLMCGLSKAELELLASSRDYEAGPVKPQALRTAIARTIRAHPVGTGSRLLGGGTAVARSLPRDIASFTGRERELDALMLAVEGASAERAPTGSGGVVGIHAIGGLPGIGKTAFAVHAAHRLAPRFPDGQVFLSLHGHTPGQKPVDPGDALASLLTRVGVSLRIPPGLEARMALWRDQMAGKRLLLLLDDAVGHEQVQPLLPGSAGSLVLVTSRRHLTALEDAQAISLDTLAPGEAAQLFARVAARPGLEPDDPAVTEITALCGYLPLAVGMLARQLHHHPTWVAAHLAADLAAARDRLELMHAEDLSVAAAFDLSYADLSDDQQTLFRRLGLHPGPDIDAYAAAALAGIALAKARRQLESLYDQNLLTEPSHGRYRFHDLIREYAQARAAADSAAENGAALDRLLDYYQYTAAIAEGLLSRQTRPWPGPVVLTPPVATIPDLPDPAHALVWARAERANLLTCLDRAASRDEHGRVIALTAGTAALLRQDGPWTDAVARHTTAVKAARHLGDRLGAAGALNDLGDVHWAATDYSSAKQALDEALGIYRDLGDQLGQANALGNLGAVGWATADHTAATRALEAALGIYRDLGDRRGQANTLLDLGAVRGETSDYPAAALALEEASKIYRDLGDRRGQANALGSLGVLKRVTGDYPGATAAHQEQLEIFRDLVIKKGQANALLQLGAVRRAIEDYAGASEALEEALGIILDLGDQLAKAVALGELGVMRRLAGDRQGAAEAHQEQLEIYRGFGNQEGEAEALNELGTLHRIGGDLSEADACHGRALQLAREKDIAWLEAHALAGLARSALAAGRTAEAEAGLRQARDIFQRIGAAEAASLNAELGAM